MIDFARRILFALSLVASLAGLARAQPQEAGPSPSPSSSKSSAELAPGSPRVSVQAFLDACRREDYETAAEYLVLDGVSSGRGPELARRLKAVLDRHLWIDLSMLSPLQGGNPADGLEPGMDLLGEIGTTEGRMEPVRIVRVEDAAGARWAFSAGTVARIDSWFEALGHQWARENLPPALLRLGPKNLLYWQWLALAPLLLIAWGLGRLLGAVTRRVLARLASRTRAEWDDELLVRLAGPLTLAWALIVTGGLLTFLDLYAPAELFLSRGLKSAGLVVVFWGLWCVVDVAAEAARSGPWIDERPSARSLLFLGERFGKVAVVALGVVAALSELGYPIASMVAGLGLGGLAFALAAQKTVENVFGSVSLAADEPFRVGDFVRIGDSLGTVEVMGLRSTQIRTLDRTLVSIPNGGLSEMRIESLSARDRMRLACIVSLVYSTTALQMREVLEGLERVLRAHPLIWPDSVVVRFKELGASSLDIEIMAWFQTQEWSEFQLIRQDILLEFMEVVEKAGSEFAFPTQTLHIAGSQEPVPPKP